MQDILSLSGKHTSDAFREFIEQTAQLDWHIG
jgi:hypothetical protein